jgi:hypothetical protein
VLMRRRGPDEPGDGGDEPLPDRGRAVMVLVIVLLLVVGGLVLVRELRNMSLIQDCTMSGRTNCAPITAGDR